MKKSNRTKISAKVVSWIFKCVYILTGVAFTSCDFSFQLEDSKKDIEEGKRICVKFLEFEKKQATDSVFPLVTNITQSELQESLHVTDSLLGEIVDFSYLDGKSNAKNSINGSSETKYTISYTVNRKRKQSKRIFHLIKQENIVKVQGYEDKFNLDLR